MIPKILFLHKISIPMANATGNNYRYYKKAQFY